jgi:hypothetical protein
MAFVLLTFNVRQRYMVRIGLKGDQLGADNLAQAGSAPKS